MRLSILAAVGVVLLVGVHAEEEFEERHVSLWRSVLPHVTVEQIESAIKQVGVDWSDYLEERGDLDDGPSPLASCPQCRSLIASLRTLINNGNQCEDVRDLAISVCVPIADGMGYLGDYICPGLIDNFCPDVVYTLNNTDISPQEFCVFHRQCDPTGYTAPEWNVPSPAMKKAAPTVPKRDYDDYLKVLHLTDIHVDQHYMPGEPDYCQLPLCCRDHGVNGTDQAEPAGFWGMYQCGVPTHTITSFLTQIRQMDDIDIIVYTGDSPPHAVWDETQEGQIDDSRWVTEVLDAVWPDVHSYTAIGNHDTFPVNMYGRERPGFLTEDLNEKVGNYWGEVSRFGQEQYDTFYAGGYYAMPSSIPGITIVSYNSNYGTTENFFGYIPFENGEASEMMTYIENALAEARENGEKVILLGHHPTGSSGYFRYFDSWMYDITDEYGDVIILHFLGHSHSDNMQLTMNRETGEPKVAWMSTGSVVTYTNTNPSGKIFYVDPETFTPVDYDAYYLDFETVVDDPDAEPIVTHMFRASEDYGLPDLTAQSWGDMLDRMETDDELYRNYKYNQNTRRREPGTCEGTCRLRELCGLRTVTGDDANACRSQIP